MIKKILFPLLFSITFCASCVKDAEIQPKLYPYMITHEIDQIDSTGATFIGEIANFNSKFDYKYGFVWGEKSKPTISDYKVFIENGSIDKNYTFHLNHSLVKDKNYYVRAFAYNGQLEVYGNEISFKSKGCPAPLVLNFFPKSGSPGTPVLVVGRNFSPNVSENTIKFGNIIATIDSATETQIYTKVPQVNATADVDISVETSEMIAHSSTQFNIWFPWFLEKGILTLNDNSTTFTIQDKTFIIRPNNIEIGYYLSATNEWWWRPNNIPENPGYRPIAYSVNGKGYILLEKNFWEFDPETYSWVIKAAFPGNIQTDENYRFGFAISGKIYIGNCYGNFEFWEYDPSQDLWQRKADFKGINSSVSGNYSFSVNNYGFLGINQTGSKSFWMYDPELDSWTNKAAIPLDSYTDFACFVINNIAYVGLGNNSEWYDGYCSNQLWKYDFSHDKWIRSADCPEHLGILISFSDGAKGYMLSGYTRYYNYLYHVWEFDPSKN